MKIIMLLIIVGFISSCASTPKITRIEAEESIDISGNWNDTDSRLVAEEMIRDSLTRAWLDEFLTTKKTKPRVIVGTVKNRSHEHINTQTFVKDLERELTNSGKVVFVASKLQREEIRQERTEQSMFASPETAKEHGFEYGADFMIQGQINTILDEAGKIAIKYYQVELEMLNVLTNEKVWIGQKKIKKLVKRSRMKL